MIEKKPANENETSPSDCCPDGAAQGCCLLPQAATNAECRDSAYRSWGKKLALVLIVSMALAAGTYSFYKRSTAKAQGQERLKIGSNLDERPGLSTDSPAAKDESSKTDASSCDIPSNSMKLLGAQAVDKDAVFLFLPGDNKGKARSVSRQVEKVVDMLSAKGKKVVSITLTKNDEGYDQLKEEFSVESLPSVVIAGGGCRPMMLNSSEITESNLLLAFVLASSPPSSCETPCQ
jgi:hypothetical protein